MYIKMTISLVIYNSNQLCFFIINSLGGYAVVSLLSLKRIPCILHQNASFTKRVHLENWTNWKSSHVNVHAKVYPHLNVEIKLRMQWCGKGKLIIQNFHWFIFSIFVAMLTTFIHGDSSPVCSFTLPDTSATCSVIRLCCLKIASNIE